MKLSEMYIIKQKNYDLNVNESSKQANQQQQQNTANTSNLNLNSNTKKLPKIELVQSQSPKNESQPTTR